MLEIMQLYAFLHWGWNPTVTHTLSYIVLIIVVAGVSFLANFLTKLLINHIVSRIVSQTKTHWDDIIMENKVFIRLSHIVPAIIIYMFSFWFSSAEDWIQRFALIYLILIGLWVIDSLLTSVVMIYRTYEISKRRPIKTYIQLVKIFFYVITGILIVATLLNINPWGLLTGLGAIAAVLLFSFKDSILGFIASIQLSVNDMVRRGDWIEVPSYGADGDVIDVTINTVKVRNWDKTISTIPTHALISDTFKNWRGMTESGGRRIKRSIFIDINSIRFCDETLLERFKQIEFLKPYLESKLKEVEEDNQSKQIDLSNIVNGRRLTNIGTFRAYIQAYLQHHEQIHQDMTFLIRQLQPMEKGLPIEIYVFCKDQRWVFYEGIQADIFDHLLAVLPEFELRVFQEPTGNDFQIRMNGAGVN